ncbi:MAG TPA: NTP transferase domain-containing protein [Gaiellaceae bacterium]|nr:NTP transferase domain-containing protein [Gaiellaceae bacterium]
MAVYAVILAAGASSRYGASPPKQQVHLASVVAALEASSVAEIVVVSGAHEVECDARIVRCPEWERGPGASLRSGLAALPDEAEAAIVVLADGPDLDPRAIDRVAASWHADGGDVVAASYGGVRLHPVLLARAAWPRIPDEGARTLEARLVPCDDLTPPGDVDEPPTRAGS